jgi:uncharacterized phage protein (TIGR02220 family)
MATIMVLPEGVTSAVKMMPALVWATVSQACPGGMAKPDDLAAVFGVPPWIIRESFDALCSAKLGTWLNPQLFQAIQPAQAQPTPVPPPPDDGDDDDVRKAAVMLIDVVRQVSGREVVKPTADRVKLVLARLEEVDRDVDGVEKMLRRQGDLWRGSKMEQYLRVETLFLKRKFMSYYEARNTPISWQQAVAEPTAAKQRVAVTQAVLL